MPEKLSAKEATKWLLQHLDGRGTVYVPGCAAEPLHLAEAMSTEPGLVSGLNFTGVWIPGVNRTDWGTLGTADTYFLSPDLRSSFNEGRTRYFPRPYTDIYTHLKKAEINAAIVHISPPNPEGYCSLGVANDFTPAVLDRQIPLIGIVNDQMPTVPTSNKLKYTDLTIAIESSSPLLTYDAGHVSDDLKKIAGHIASFIPKGGTVQFGLGKVQKAVLEALDGHRFSIHAGMISDPVMPLLGQIDHITTGVALGTIDLYTEVAKAPQVKFAPVSHTHDINILRSIHGLVAINSVVEVDLFGQANAEFINGQQVSGSGGLVDFLRGAKLANGCPIIALPSTTRKGTDSRIIPMLPADIPASVARGDECIVVTENGVADLRGRSIDQKAYDLINVAHPNHQDQLMNDWDRMRRAM